MRTFTAPSDSDSLARNRIWHFKADPGYCEGAYYTAKNIPRYGTEDVRYPVAMEIKKTFENIPGIHMSMNTTKVPVSMSGSSGMNGSNISLTLLRWKEETNMALILDHFYSATLTECNSLTAIVLWKTMKKALILFYGCFPQQAATTQHGNAYSCRGSGRWTGHYHCDAGSEIKLRAWYDPWIYLFPDAYKRTSGNGCRLFPSWPASRWSPV